MNAKFNTLPPWPADRYRHKKSGGIYEVVAFAERESDQMPLVVYRSLDTLRTWVRPMTEWREKFEYLAAPPEEAREEWAEYLRQSAKGFTADGKGNLVRLLPDQARAIADLLDGRRKEQA